MPTINQLVRKGRTKIQEKGENTCSSKLSAETRCMCKGLYIYSQKTQFCPEKSRQSEIDKRYRGNLVYPRGRPQSSGALGCAYPRRTGQGFARCTLPYHKGYHGYRRCGRSTAGPFQIWGQKAKGYLKEFIHLCPGKESL